MNVLLSENQILIFSPHENTNFCNYALSQKPPVGEKDGRKISSPIKTFEKNQVLKQFFNNLSDFEIGLS